MYRPEIGDVIAYNNKEMVIVDMVNHENIGSCAYDRQYLVCDLDYLAQNHGAVILSDIIAHGAWIDVRGIDFPEFKKIEDAVPFFIEPVKCYTIRPKSAKVITIYE